MTTLPGDEVGCIVMDLGSSTLKAGYSGEDMPKAVIPSAVGLQYKNRKGETKTVGEGEDSIATGSPINYFAGTEQLLPRHENTEIRRPLTDGLVSDWDSVDLLFQHTLNVRLRVNPRERPILLAEPSFNTKANREKATELLFEKYEVPALFISKNAVLSCFSYGRSSGLVIDCGEDTANFVPVMDGYVLTDGIRKSPIAGKLLNSEYNKFLTETKKITVRPHYLVKKHQLVGDRYKVEILDYPNIHPSYNQYHVNNIVNDMKISVSKISEVPFDASHQASIPTVPYELPDGSTVEIGAERFEIVESMFNPQILNTMGDETQLSYQQLVIQSINSCDYDIRRELQNGILVNGGGSLFEGFTERLQYEIQRQSGSARIKVIGSNASSIEKLFAVWIGGSILSSLGSFQQLWMGKSEYEERGKSLVERKCP